MRSIASGLISSKREGVPPGPVPLAVLSTRTPSIYTTGSLDCDSVEDPRMRIEAPSPFSPPFGSMTTPFSRP